jgi:hypothetical protein
MNIDFWFNDTESEDDLNNFTFANAIYNECKNRPELNAKVVAKMILLQSKQDSEVEE